MNNKQMLLFCGISLVLTLGIATLLFPHAVMSDEQHASLATAQPATSLGKINLGGFFGNVAVADLVDYYVSNPPNVSLVPVSVETERFGGC